MTTNPQYNRESCYFCHEPDTHLLEAHHIVPRRFDGSDDPENLVRVCPTCHERLERLYDGRFFDALGIETETDDDSEAVGTDFDADVVETGQGKPQRDRIKSLRSLISEIESEYEEGAPIETIFDRAEAVGIERSQVEHEIEKLREQGDVYEQISGHLRTV